MKWAITNRKARPELCAHSGQSFVQPGPEFCATKGQSFVQAWQELCAFFDLILSKKNQKYENLARVWLLLSKNNQKYETCQNCDFKQKQQMNKPCQGCVIDAKNQMMKNMPELCGFNQRNQKMATS